MCSSSIRHCGQDRGELVELSKQRDNGISFASPARQHQFSSPAEMLRIESGGKFLHVPYKAAAPPSSTCCRTTST